MTRHWLRRRFSIAAIALFAATQIANAQEIKVVSSLKLRRNPNDYFLSKNKSDLYLFENGKVVRYNMKAGAQGALYDTLSHKHLFHLLSGPVYLKQSEDALVLHNLDTHQERVVPYNGIHAWHFSLDTLTGKFAIATNQARDGVVIVDRNNSSFKISISDTSTYLIPRISMSPGGKYVFIYTIKSDGHFDDIVVYDLNKKKETGRFPQLAGRDVRFINDSTFYSLNAWGSLRENSIDPFEEIADGIHEFKTSDTPDDEFEKVITFQLLQTRPLILTASTNGVLSVWNTATQDKVHAIALDHKPVEMRRVHFSNDFLVLCEDGALILVSVSSPATNYHKPPMELVLQTKQKDQVTKLMLDSVNNYFYTTGEEELKVWDRTTLMQIKAFPKTSLFKVSRDHRYLVATRSILDISTLRDITPYGLTTFYLGQLLNYEHDRHRILQLYYDTLRYVDFRTMQATNLVPLNKYYNGKTGTIATMAVSDELDAVATGINYNMGICTNWKIVITGLPDGREIAVLDGTRESNSCIRGMLFSARHGQLISYDDEKLIFWDVKKGKRLKEFVLKEDWGNPAIKSVALAWGGDHLLVGYHNGRILKWDLKRHIQVAEYAFGDGYNPVSALDPISEETVILASFSNLKLYDFQNKLEVAHFGNPEAVEGVSKLLLHDRSDVLYSLKDESLSRWDFRSLLSFKQAGFQSGAPPFMKDVEFSTDSAKVICTGFVRYPNVYDPKNGWKVNGTGTKDSLGNDRYGVRSIPLKDGRIITLTDNIGKQFGFCIYGSDGGLVRNLSKEFSFATIERNTLVLNKAQDSLYFVAKSSSYDDYSYLLAISLRTYRPGKSIRFKTYSISHSFLMNDSLLLLAGHQMAIVNLRTRKVERKNEGPGYISSYYYDKHDSLLFAGGHLSVQVWKIGKLIYCMRNITMREDVSALAYDYKRKLLYTGHKNGEINLFNVSTLAPVLSLYPIDTANFILASPDGYYYTTKQAAPEYLSYRSASRHYLFAQFDHQLNRPDIIARKLFGVKPEEIALLDGVAKQRSRNSGQQSVLEQEIVPLKILDRFKIPTVVSSNVVRLGVDATNLGSFTRLFVYVNGSYDKELPIVQGKPLALEITLNKGLNTIRLYAADEPNNRSSVEEVRVVYKSATPVASRLFFIGIGLNTYTRAPAQQLTYAVNDIQDLDSLFRAQKGDVVVKTFVESAVTKGIVGEIKSILDSTTPEDKVIIAFSGHGVTDAAKNFYFGTSDIDFNDPSVAGINYAEIEGLLKHTPARKKLLVLDACFSGEVDRDEVPVKPGDLSSALSKAKQALAQPRYQLPKDKIEVMKDMFADLFRADGTVIISAARGSGVALEDEGLGNSTFTYYLKEALAERSQRSKPKDAADVNDDGLSINEMKAYVLRKVAAQTHGRQQPTTRMENASYDWKVWE